MKKSFSITGQLVDVVAGKMFPGKVKVKDGKILSVTPVEVAENQFILPGLIDAHVHIESSMLVPSEFARLAVVHGTTATVSDPHEIANVLGMEGIDFMINNGNLTPFKFHFGAPSCVPATVFESSGAVINASQIDKLLQRNDICYLSEMMNFPGVIFGDQEVHQKLAFAKQHNKPVDGHAPGLDSENIKKYADAGITTDHECTTISEAIEKINAGMHILIREGSAARNFEALVPLLATHPEKVMFCSDDKHPDDLVTGHINLLIKRALWAGYDEMAVIRACTLNPVRHYKLTSGLLQPGDPADIVTVDNLAGFNIQKTFINGILVASEGKSLLQSYKDESPNRFLATPATASDIEVVGGEGKMKVIEAFDGALVTEKFLADPVLLNGKVVSDVATGIMKITVINRYEPSKPAVAFIRGFGLQRGAMASTVAHDSHNIICIGTNDADMVSVINCLIAHKGGIAVTDGQSLDVLPLPVAGLMTGIDGYEVAEKYENINKKALALGGPLKAPFMTLSFMALLVIPELKLSDKGLFDGIRFSFTELFEGASS
ncbi:MAG: adenine deaminase [Bacteroidales bacterium]|nr:adenine deaminase [Bacteroidales bacterium]